MSLIQSSGIKYKKENFKALKDEIKNINYSINKGGVSSIVLLNENNQYVCRIQNRDAYYSKSSPETNYIFNQILKQYELNKDQTAQGFNEKYIKELTELLSLRHIHTKDYTKKRIELFNSRINKYHKSYINYLKKKGEDANLQSTINKKIKTIDKTLNIKVLDTIKLRDRNIFSKKRSKTKLSLTNKSFLKSDLFSYIKNISYFNQINENINRKNDNGISTAKDESFNSKLINNKKNHLYNSVINLNKFKIRNSNENLEKNFSSLSPINKDKNKNDKNDLNQINDNNNNDDDDEMKKKEDESKEEFLRTYDRKKYMDFLKTRYSFIKGNRNEEKDYKKTIEIMRRHNMFKLRPKEDFLKKQVKDMDKLIFFKRIENNNNKKLNASSEIKIKKRKYKNVSLSPKIIRKILDNSIKPTNNIF